MPRRATTCRATAQRVASLSRVTYPNLWDGVTLIYDAPSGAVVRSTYRLEAHANAGNIRLRYNAPVAVQSDGSLRVSFQTGTLNESAPQAWQERNGKRCYSAATWGSPTRGFKPIQATSGVRVTPGPAP